MANLIEILIPKAHAQVDSFAQPTFGSIDIGGGTTVSGTVLLTSSSTSVTIGQKFKVTVAINTNDVNINEYRVVIDFDPTKLQVVDADPATAGTQIKFLDTVFEVEDQLQDNTVANVGRIRLRAVAPSQPLAVNRNVAEIEFQAQTTGSPVIKVVEGTTGTQLVRQAGIGLAYTSNEVTVALSTQQTSGSGGTTTGGTNGQGTTPSGGQTTPNTALPTDLGSIITIFLGVILVVVGASLKSKKTAAS